MEKSSKDMKRNDLKSSKYRDVQLPEYSEK